MYHKKRINKMAQTIYEIIESARKYLQSGIYSEMEMAVYILRDTPEIKLAKLDDLAWAMLQETMSKNDVLFLIEHLEKYLFNCKNIEIQETEDYKKELFLQEDNERKAEKFDMLEEDK
jgi:hypothetical protein